MTFDGLLHALHELAPGVLQRVDRFLDAGGLVMWPLIAIGFVMWYLIALRAFDLRRGLRAGQLEPLLTCDEPVAKGGIVGRAACRIRDLLGDRYTSFGDAELVLKGARERVGAGAKAIQTLVAAAPLLGLLGTVVGMMETFYALRDMSMFAESGGVAGGISAALVTTQTGLGIAVPGLIVERILGHRGRTIERDLELLAVVARRRFEAREVPA